METKRFGVSGMKCEHCKANVESAIRGLAGVKTVEASLTDACVHVEYDAAVVDAAGIKAAVEASGRYELTL